MSNLPAVRCLQEPNELALTKRVAFLVGENGVGKSTLMEALAIAMGFNPEGGTINFRFSTADSHSELYRYLTVIKGASRRQDGFFYGRKASIIWRRRSTGWTGSHPWADG